MFLKPVRDAHLGKWDRAGSQAGRRGRQPGEAPKAWRWAGARDSATAIPPDIPLNVRVAMLPSRDHPNDCMTGVRMPTWPLSRDKPKPTTTRDDLDPQTTPLIQPGQP